MLAPPELEDEAERLAALHATGLLDTEPEERFDAITRLLARMLDCPMATVTLVDAQRQWFKSRVGLDASETPRSESFCGHAIAGSELFIVPDATNDARFQDNPAVVNDPNVRFYAGRPLHGPGGWRVGTLCAIDTRPRELDAHGRAVIEDLARLAERELQLTDMARLQRRVIDVQSENEKLLASILPPAIARALRTGGGRMVAHSLPDVAILFADIVDSSSLAASLAPQELVGWLNTVFSAIDELCRELHVDKIKTIGDAYMAAAGLSGPADAGMERIADLALAVRELATRMQRPDGTPLAFRIGMHCGPVTAGVIGIDRYAYDLWGHAVNVASRLETSASAGAILASDAARDRVAGRYAFDALGKQHLKGIGEIGMNALLCRVSR